MKQIIQGETLPWIFETESTMKNDSNETILISKRCLCIYFFFSRIGVLYLLNNIFYLVTNLLLVIMKINTFYTISKELSLILNYEY